MALMLAEVYAAFRAANVPEEQARKAAEALAAYTPPLGDLRRELRLHSFLLVTILGGVVTLCLKVLFDQLASHGFEHAVARLWCDVLRFG